MFYFKLLILLSPGYLIVCSSDKCKRRESCDKCVRDVACHWCSSENYLGVRCLPVAESFVGCNRSYIENPSSFSKIKEDRSFSSATEEVTQIKPQNIKVIARLGEPREFDINFKAADDYPADLYFLVDASHSMAKVMTTIGEASAEIYKEMRKITKNVFLGMGTFIDKNTAPYVTARDTTNNNTYSFRHRVSMTPHFNNISESFRTTPTGENYDDPEGGFDALAQVMACKDEVGWRELSRKIIFYVTDAEYHSAGDGRWAGIVQPYDKGCYTKNGIYTKEIEMDYPSVGIINTMSVENEIMIIFIVNQNKAKHYDNLIQTNARWKVLTYITRNGVIEFEEHKLQELISKIYTEISHTVHLKLSIPAEIQNDIKFSFIPDCYKRKKRQDCTVKTGIDKPFKGKLMLLENFSLDETKINLTIQGIKEKVTLNIKIAKCSCSETPENRVSCSDNGFKKCGVCECDKDWTGKNCQCEANKLNIEKADTCTPDNSTDLLCNGFGACTCGRCHCDESHEGKFCECIKNICPRQCSGHGRCYCGQCQCHSGWTGGACDCPTDKGCRRANNKECNGRGKCVCGKCQCQPLDSWDARETQSNACEVEPCKNCHPAQCLKLKDCAICHLDNNPDKCADICTENVKVDTIQYLENATDIDDYFVCESVQAGFGCYARFQYKYNDIKYGAFVFVQTTTNCLENYYAMGGGCLLAFILIGIATLVAWKVLTRIRDRKEYEKFVQSLSEGASCQNPIYEPASTTFRNPAFRKPSVDFNLK